MTREFFYDLFVGGGDWKVLVLMVFRPETLPLIISVLFYVSQVQSAKYIYIYTETVIRATQTRVISHPAVVNFYTNKMSMKCVHFISSSYYLVDAHFQVMTQLH